jgi:CheY-like chemotaxis protein
MESLGSRQRSPPAEEENVSHRVLIVDPNQAFATMLQQSLEEGGDYSATAVGSGREALRAVSARNYDLAIIDMGLQDVEGPSLIRRLRGDHPELRLLVIPIAGEDIPEELSDVQLQGALPKPFFLPELPDRIGAALSTPFGGAAPAPGASSSSPPPPPPAPVEEPPDLQMHLMQLLQEMRAQAVILIRDEELVAHTSRLPLDEVEALAAIIHESWNTSARVAQILGKEQLRFEQSIEGDEHLLYSLALSPEVILSVVVEGHVPLGMIRHRAKETAEGIRGLIGTAI